LAVPSVEDSVSGGAQDLETTSASAAASAAALIVSASSSVNITDFRAADTVQDR